MHFLSTAISLPYAPTSSSLSVKLLEHLGLAKRFVAVCGPDTFGIEKPDPEFLRRTVATAGGMLERAIMIGASIVDIRTARGRHSDYCG
jgi:phosphoglycolate phosphatase